MGGLEGRGNSGKENEREKLKSGWWTNIEIMIRKHINKEGIFRVANALRFHVESRMTYVHSDMEVIGQSTFLWIKKKPLYTVCLRDANISVNNL